MIKDNRNIGFRALLLTQFLEAFNDNAIKVIVTFVAIDYFTQQGLGTLYVSLASALFILPFLLFSSLGGFLADRFSKKTIIVFAKVAELIILLIGLASFIHINIYGMLTVLFLMGLHSALLSPSKYAILPEILDKDDLSEGNGQLQMWTYAAIILGQACGGYLLHIFGEHIFKAYFVLIGLAVLGIMTSLFITKVTSANTQRTFEWNFIKETALNLKTVRTDKTIFLSLMGLVYFAFLGGIFQPNILLYAKTLMGVDSLLASILLISVSLGIGIGSVMAGKFSDQKVELGLVPLGAIGISIFAFLLGFFHTNYLGVFMTLFMLGLSSGFYIVPLNTLIQQNSPPDARGKIIATNNVLSFSAILIASGSVYFFGEVLKFNSAHTFIFLGVLTILGTIYICRILPYPLVRLIVWLLAHTIYKIRAINKESIPAEGGALIVANHVSYMDAVMLVVTVPRPVRFIMSRGIFGSSIFNFIFKIGRAIPIDSKDNPKDLIRALHTAKQAIKDGELVCIFPEGQLTKTGNIHKFHEGVEHILKDNDCPVIPVHLDRIWGSIFSYEKGVFFFKWPKILPYPVTISFGSAMPSTSTAFEIRSKVLELGADAFQYRLQDKMTLSQSFWKMARKQPRKFCIADSSGRKLNYAETLISAVALSQKMHAQVDQEKCIGIILPPSVAGALVNMAVSILNKVPVNINYTSSKESIASMVKQTAMQYCITSKTFLEKTGLEIACEKIFIEDLTQSISTIDKIKAAICSYIYPSVLSHHLVFGFKSYRQQENLSTIMFTSGSTGEPKGVMLTHGNITSNLEGLYQVFNSHDNDVMMGVLPFFHSFGFTATLWFPLISGNAAVYHFNPLDAKVNVKMVEEHKATILMATPTFLSMYIRRCEPEQFKSLRVVTVGAEKLKNTLAEEFKSKFGVEPMEGYGCTELSPVVTINLPEIEVAGVIQKTQKKGSIGLPLPGIAVRIVDQETQLPLGPNQNGILQVKGPNVMKGYLNNLEKTQEVIKEGWYTTGDVAQMDKDGFIIITDRLSRFSKIAGEMVPHIKIEEAIHQALGSTEQVAVVTSVPDERKGEKIIVLHTVDIDQSKLIDQLKGLGLPNLWIPDKEMFFKIDAIPLLGTGKLDLGGIKQKAKKIVREQQK